MSETTISAADIDGIRTAICDYVTANGSDFTIYRRSVTQDDLGEEVESWSEVGAVKGFVRLGRTVATVYRDGQEVVAPVRQTTVTFCYTADVQAGDKAVSDGGKCYILDAETGGPLALAHTFVLREVRC